ncbi:non-homologous end joining protein Ku [Specibacter sp. RAF43]|uniref:non-homologous end joining protein Ku n=1 Tax=Specibacter sp. RAF43 TaxID=3233057 RepID=UPI003F97071F
MRPIWKGAVTFGLVNVPVKLYSATQDHDLSLHQVHGEDGGRIRYERRCEVCGEVVAYEDIDKAYEDGDKTVVLTGEDFAVLPHDRSREIEVVEFVPGSQLDPITFDRSYFLEPDSSSVKAYALLMRTLKDTELTAIVQFSLRQKTKLGALRTHGKVMVLQSLLWADEVREADFPALAAATRISEREREMSASLVAQYADDFSPKKYRDEYQAELRKLVDAKMEQGDALDTEATFGRAQPEGDGEVVDLMEALQRSIERKRQKKGPAAAAGTGKARGRGKEHKAAGKRGA